jgi:ATP-dependent Lon protease
MRGDELAREAQKRTPETPVILLTGFGTMMEAAGEEVEGVDAVLSKPVRLSQLRDAILNVTGDGPEE